LKTDFERDFVLNLIWAHEGLNEECLFLHLQGFFRHLQMLKKFLNCPVCKDSFTPHYVKAMNSGRGRCVRCSEGEQL